MRFRLTDPRRFPMVFIFPDPADPMPSPQSVERRHDADRLIAFDGGSLPAEIEAACRAVDCGEETKARHHLKRFPPPLFTLARDRRFCTKASLEVGFHPLVRAEVHL